MLMLTDNATRVIGALVEQRPELPDGAGLRIATTSEEDRDTTGLTLATSEGPRPGDQVVGQEALVFLQPDAAEMLDDKVLDAQVDDAGQVQFVVTPQ